MTSQELQDRAYGASSRPHCPQLRVLDFSVSVLGNEVAEADFDPDSRWRGTERATFDATVVNRGACSYTTSASHNAAAMTATTKSQWYAASPASLSMEPRTNKGTPYPMSKIMSVARRTAMARSSACHPPRYRSSRVARRAM